MITSPYLENRILNKSYYQVCKRDKQDIRGKSEKIYKKVCEEQTDNATEVMRSNTEVLHSNTKVMQSNTSKSWEAKADQANPK